MKTIIAGVDFSKSSANAAQYAAMLAGKTNSRLLLFNMYDVPLIHSNSGLYIMSIAPQRSESENRMETFAKKIKKSFPQVQVDSFVSTGGFRDELERLIKSRHVQYVVMGLSSKDRFTKFIYGSHSTDIAGRLNVPVIIVPDNFSKHHLHKVLLGVDNRSKLHKSSLRSLEHLTHDCHAGLEVLHIKTEQEVFEDESKKTVAVEGKEKQIEEVRAKTIQEGLGRSARRKKADLVAIISKKHSVFYKLFNESATKEVAFASKVPVMSIHE